MYDIIVTLHNLVETKVISLRIEAESRSAALAEANKKLNEMGYAVLDRVACSVRDAR